MQLDPHLSSGAAGAEALQQSAVMGGAYTLQQLVEAMARALSVSTDQIKIMVGSRNAYPKTPESPELIAKALDALTNPDSKRAIKIIAQIDGQSEPVFWQTGGKVQVDQDGFKARFDQALKEPTLEMPTLQKPALEPPPLIQEPTMPTIEPEPTAAPEWLKTAMDGALHPTPVLAVEPQVMSGPPTIEDPQATNLMDPTEFFKQRVENLQQDLNSAKQQLDSVLGQVQTLTQHVAKLTEDPRVQEWANKANNVFMEKTQGLRTKLKTGAISLATNLYDRARQWAIDSPKIDAAIDSLIQRQGKDNKIELGGLTFSNQDGNRSISKDGQPLYSGGFLSDKIATEDIKTVCRIPDRAEKFCKAFDEFHKTNDMKQAHPAASTHQSLERNGNSHYQ